MSNVKMKNGFTRIPNDLLEAVFQIKLKPNEYRVLLFIWRYTYGFNRHAHTFSLNYISNGTKINRNNVQKILNGLEEKKMIFRHTGKNKVRIITFNSNFKEWTGVGEIIINNESVVNIDNTCSDVVNLDVVNTNYTNVVNTNHKEIKNKERIKEIPKNDFSDQFVSFWTEYPKKVGKKAAATKFKTVIKKYDLETILNGVKGYKERCERDKVDSQFIQHPKTFLNQETFLDYQPIKEEKPVVNPEWEKIKYKQWLEDTVRLGLNYYKTRGIEDQYFRALKELEEFE